MQLNVARLIKSVVCNGTPEVHSRVYKSSPLVPFLIHINSTPLHLLSLIHFNSMLQFLCTQVCCVQTTPSALRGYNHCTGVQLGYVEIEVIFLLMCDRRRNVSVTISVVLKCACSVP